MYKKWFSENIKNRNDFSCYEIRAVKIINVISGNIGYDQGSIVLSQKSKDDYIWDFGQNLNGSVSIKTGGLIDDKWFAKVRIRFGESISEVMNEPDNTHSIHDAVLDLSALARHEFGNTGFRFLRINLADEDSRLEIVEVKALAKERPFEYLGSFNCSNELLNQVWKTAARTTHLCCQDVIYDGIKRDRMLWVGDLHIPIKVISAVFGKQDIVYQSLRAALDNIKHKKSYNNIFIYDMLYIMCVWDWYFYTGDIEFLKEIRIDLNNIIDSTISNCINVDGLVVADGIAFVDWVLETDIPNRTKALQAVAFIAMENAQRLTLALGESSLNARCQSAIAKMRKRDYQVEVNMQVNSLHILSGLVDCWPNTHAQALPANQNISPWYGYYLLEALAVTGKYDIAIDFIESYWGGMLSLGATSFWEHFEISWLENASRIDEMPGNDKVDIHKTYGDHCYKGLRHSLCHAWASGPAVWLINHILGIKPVAVGCSRVEISPHLGQLDYAKGSMPVADGVINVEVVKDSSGKQVVKYDAPENVEVVVISE